MNLNPSASAAAGIYWHSNITTQQVIITYHNIPHGTALQETVTFQVVLDAIGTVLFRYLDIDSTNPVLAKGIPASIGVSSDLPALFSTSFSFQQVRSRRNGQ